MTYYCNKWRQRLPLESGRVHLSKRCDCTPHRGQQIEVLVTCWCGKWEKEAFSVRGKLTEMRGDCYCCAGGVFAARRNDCSGRCVRMRSVHQWWGGTYAFSLGSGHRVNLVCKCARFIQGPSFLKLCLIPNFFLLFSPAVEYSRCWLPVEEKPLSKGAVLVESLAVSLLPLPVASVLPVLFSLRLSRVIRKMFAISLSLPLTDSFSFREKYIRKQNKKSVCVFVARFSWLLT